MSAADKKAAGQRHPWRDNLEAVTMAIVMAVMLKYFIVEAYKIPTGSMQPTLLGNDETGIFDRIIVDKLSYHFRDPERFEVAVFKYPLDRSKNFIKRICGMPGEQFRIDKGDLWSRPDSNAEWQIVRRPKPIQTEVWKHFDRESARFASWKPVGARGWTIEGRSAIQARGDGAARLPNDAGSVMDAYRDGYPGKMGAALGRNHPGSHPVGDLRLEGDVRALAGCKLVAIELREGNRSYVFELPGPAAPAEATPQIVVRDVVTNSPTPEPRIVRAARWKLPVQGEVSFGVQNMDDRLTFEIDGETVAELDVDSASNQASSITLRIEGEGADFSDLEGFRDIYYTEARTNEFTIPDDSYVMLGDNTQDSSDSREWQLISYRWPKSDGFVRGNWRGENENPQQVTGDPEGNRIFFRDEWGELHTFLSQQAEAGRQPETAPFVPRHLITGRAVVVFWPFAPSLNVWRLKWVH